MRGMKMMVVCLPVVLVASCQAVFSGDDPTGDRDGSLTVGYGVAPAPSAAFDPLATAPQTSDPRHGAPLDSVIRPDAAPKYECPAPSRYAQVAQRAFCVWEVSLPAAPTETFCHAVSEGLIGFSFRLDELESSHYKCPDGFFFQRTDADVGFCLALSSPLPGAEVQPYCDQLDHGHIGFSWSLDPAAPLNEAVLDENATLCPTGSALSTNGIDRAWCLFDSLPVPIEGGVQPFCHWLDGGWLGFQWSTHDELAVDCPDGWDHSASDDGVTEFCMRKLDVMPVSKDLEPYCHFLYQGMIGFQWPLGQ